MAATPASSKRRARSMAVSSLVSAQPSTATLPPRASMPTATRPGKRRQASRTSAGSRTATVPRITRRMPLASQASMVARSRMPPPSCTGHGHGAEDRLDRRRVDRLAGEGAVEIDDVQVAEALGLERAGLRGRIVVEDGGLSHLAALQAHALAVLQVDGGKQDHRASLAGRAASAAAAISSLSCAAINGRHVACSVKTRCAATSRASRSQRRPGALTEADAIDIWIARWLRIRRKDLLARYGCDPRRLYEIWEEKRFPGSRAKAAELFAERHPGLTDRIDFGPHRRIPRRPSRRSCSRACSTCGPAGTKLELPARLPARIAACSLYVPPLVRRRGGSPLRCQPPPSETPHAHLPHHLRYRRPQPPRHRQRHHAAGRGLGPPARRHLVRAVDRARRRAGAAAQGPLWTARTAC